MVSNDTQPPIEPHSSELPKVESARWLAVEISGQPFLIPLGHSGEIFPWVKPHPVPYTKAWFLGVVNLRGALNGVVDISLLLNAASALDSTSQLPVGEKCFVGFHPSLEINSVLLVDKLLGLKNNSAMDKSDEQGQWVDKNRRVWVEIDMFSLAKNASFMSIAATD